MQFISQSDWNLFRISMITSESFQLYFIQLGKSEQVTYACAAYFKNGYHKVVVITITQC